MVPQNDKKSSLFSGLNRYIPAVNVRATHTCTNTNYFCNHLSFLHYWLISSGFYLYFAIRRKNRWRKHWIKKIWLKTNLTVKAFQVGAKTLWNTSRSFKTLQVKIRLKWVKVQNQWKVQEILNSAHLSHVAKTSGLSAGSWGRSCSSEVLPHLLKILSTDGDVRKPLTASAMQMQSLSSGRAISSREAEIDWNWTKQGRIEKKMAGEKQQNENIASFTLIYYFWFVSPLVPLH